jgi:sec-independent protein translocase protein TatB
MGTIGPEKILVVLVVALIVLGPEKLPKIARQAGKAWSDFRRFREGLEAEVRGAFGDDGDTPITSPVTSIRDTLRDTVSSAGTSPTAAGSAEGSGSAGAESPVPTPSPPGSRPPALSPAPSELPIPPDDPSLN